MTEVKLNLGFSSVTKSYLKIDSNFLQPEPGYHHLKGIACRIWEDRAASEYIGVMIARKLHGLLVDLRAPLDLQELALRMELDEQRHTRKCLEVARFLGSSGEISFLPADLQQPWQSENTEAEFWRMIIGTYFVGEYLALQLINFCIRVLPNSNYKSVLVGIREDEKLHSNFGLLCLKSLRCRKPWLQFPNSDQAIEIADKFCDQLKHRAVVRRSDTVHFSGVKNMEIMGTLGCVHPDLFKVEYFRIMNNAIASRVKKLRSLISFK